MNALRQRIRWVFAIGLIAVLALLVAVGCSDDDNDGGDATPAATEDSSTGGADEQALQNLLESAAAAWNAGDTAGFLAHFTDAGVLAAFGATRVAAMEFLPDFIGDPPISTGDLTNVSVSGDTATADAPDFAFGIVLDPTTFSFLNVESAWLLNGEEDFAAVVPEGTTTVELSLLEYQFAFDAAEITSGNIAFAVSNVGGEEHEIAIASVTADLDIDAAFETIAPGDFPEGFDVIAVAGPWEPGTSSAVVFTEELSSGRYALLCFIEAADGTPHAFLGMTNEFTIE